MDAIKEHADEIGKSSATLPHIQCIDKLFTDMCTSFDETMGGLGGAPKFPQGGKQKIKVQRKEKIRQTDAFIYRE